MEGMTDQFGYKAKGVLYLLLVLLLEGVDGVKRLVGLLEV